MGKLFGWDIGGKASEDEITGWECGALLNFEK